MIYKGDNLEVMKHLISIGTKADLIYADPPFGIPTDKKFGLPAWKKTDYYDEFVFKKFEWLDENDKKFLSFLRPRLILMRELLSETGSIYVHLDWHVGHYVKILLDEVFGKNNFVNEIIWSYRSGGASKKGSLPKKHDPIFFYRKSESFEVNPQFERQYLDKPFMGSSVDAQGRNYVDTLLRDVIEGEINIVKDNICTKFNTRPVLNLSSERTGYGTQKPSGLLELLLNVATKEGSIIADFFGGSGTTAAVAEKLNRRWITCDQNEVSLETMCKRLEYDLNKVIEI